MKTLVEKIKAKADELAADIRGNSYGVHPDTVQRLTAELTMLLAEKVRRDASDFCSLEKKG